MKPSLYTPCLLNCGRAGARRPPQLSTIHAIPIHNNHHGQQRQRQLSTSPTPSTPRPRTTPKQKPTTLITARPFFTLLKSDTPRTLTATRTLPHPPEPLFKVISSVESYSEFLPFLSASTVTTRDDKTGYPTRAFLTVGYGPFSETFTSKVDCDKSKWVVEARSGAEFAGSGEELGKASQFPGANEGIFEYLCTKWQLVPASTSPVRTRVDLEIKFKFKSAAHGAMMSAVEGQMASVMIAAFEKRIEDIEGSR